MKRKKYGIEISGTADGLRPGVLNKYACGEKKSANTVINKEVGSDRASMKIYLEHVPNFLSSSKRGRCLTSATWLAIWSTNLATLI